MLKVSKSNLLLVVMFIATSIFVQAQTQKVKIHFEGNKAFSSDVLSEKLDTCPYDSIFSMTYTPQTFHSCLNRAVLPFLQSQGYLKADLTEVKKESNGQDLTVTVLVEEKTFYRLGNVKIKGAKFLSSEQLIDELKIEKGDVADGEKIQSWLFKRVKELYNDNGLIENDVKVKPIFKHTENSIEGVVDLDISIYEGKQFTVSQIEFKGNGQTSELYLKSLIPLREGEIFSKQLLIDGIEMLNESKLFLYSLDVDDEKDVSLVKDNKKSLVKIKVKVKELKP